MARAIGGLSNNVKDTCRSRADRSTLIKAQLSALNVATERGTSDKTEATRFSQCAHDQRRTLEAEDCDSIRCAQLISSGRRCIRPPHCLAHARPTMCCIRLVLNVWASVTCSINVSAYYFHERVERSFVGLVGVLLRLRKASESGETCVRAKVKYHTTLYRAYYGILSLLQLEHFRPILYKKLLFQMVGFQIRFLGHTATPAKKKECSFVPFTNTVNRKIHEARMSRPISDDWYE